MNILNNSYFSDEEMGLIENNVLFSLKKGGLFIFGSNEGSGTSVNGAIFQKLSGQFVIVYRIEAYDNKHIGWF